MKKLLLTLLLLTVNQAVADSKIINFEDLTPTAGAWLPDNYQGFNWSSTIAVDVGKNFYPGSGYFYGTDGNVSLTNSGGQNPLTFSNSSTFDLTSLQLTSVWGPQSITIQGIKNGVVQYSNSFSVTTTTPQILALNYKQIDTVSINGVSSWVVDDIMIGGSDLVADAGQPLTIKDSQAIQLDGSGSHDLGGDLLTYAWAVISSPAGSNPTLANANTVNPTFQADKTGDYVVRLTVSTADGETAFADVTISTINSAPVANAGSDQSGHVTDIITLDGSASSDADGNALTYTWALITKPAGSNATLSDIHAVNPSFTIDKPGNYVAQLIVNDGIVDSAPSTATISTINSAPVANAGLDQSIHEGTIVGLNGSASDVDGNPLTYKWSFSAVPAGSTATINNPTALSASFTADLAGTYVVQLVANDGLLNSAPSSVIISSTNLKPIAEAGANQVISSIGSTVKLDGTQSYDPNGDNITYQWSILSQPVGSQTQLSSLVSVSPTFIADVRGSYVIQLVVTDQWGLQSTPSNVTISFNNVAPVANAGLNQSGLVGNVVYLDGSGSSDANGNTLTYEWSFISIPKGSLVEFSNSTSVKTTFAPDIPGSYLVQLTVNDGYVDSLPSVSEIVAITLKTKTISNIQECQNLVAGLPRHISVKRSKQSVFVNKDQQKIMTQEINSLIEDIHEQEYREALADFNSILTKVDGCASKGQSDKNDWIKYCPIQTAVYNCFEKEADDLTSLASTKRHSHSSEKKERHSSEKKERHSSEKKGRHSSEKKERHRKR
ncbi:MAG: hypothetical protein D0528_07395 [Methylococcales bacterium]|nr:MAG: hypothetical protein D0528_07395 [Methylococcales bacterium]